MNTQCSPRFSQSKGEILNSKQHQSKYEFLRTYKHPHIHKQQPLGDCLVAENSEAGVPENIKMAVPLQTRGPLASTVPETAGSGTAFHCLQQPVIQEFI